MSRIVVALSGEDEAQRLMGQAPGLAQGGSITCP